LSRGFSSRGGTERGRIGHHRIPHEGKVREGALRCLGVAGAADILHNDRDEPEIGSVPHGPSMPISIAMPTMANALNPQSRRISAKGVPSNAENAILSRTASSSRGASSGTISNPGEPRRNQGRT
jgi:hypothetical protein